MNKTTNRFQKYDYIYVIKKPIISGQIREIVNDEYLILWNDGKYTNEKIDHCTNTIGKISKEQYDILNKFKVGDKVQAKGTHYVGKISRRYINSKRVKVDWLEKPNDCTLVPTVHIERLTLC